MALGDSTLSLNIGLPSFSPTSDIRASTSAGTRAPPALFITASMPSIIAFSSQVFTSSAAYSALHSTTISSWQTTTGTTPEQSFPHSQRRASADFRLSAATSSVVRHTMGVSTPLLTPLRALHAETSGNHQQEYWLNQAETATYGNIWKRVSADCGSRGGRGSSPVGHPLICRINA